MQTHEIPNTESESADKDAPIGFWRYWHRKGYWQAWAEIPPNGIFDVPYNSARKIQISLTEPTGAESEDAPDGET